MGKSEHSLLCSQFKLFSIFTILLESSTFISYISYIANMADSPERGSRENVPEAPAAAEAGAKEKPAKGKKEDKKNKEGDEKRTSVPTMPKPAAPAVRYAPTYRLEPKNPLVRERLEKIVKAEMEKNYHHEYSFHPKTSLRMAAHVSEDIKNRIKGLNFDRYRYIVVTTVGEYLMQGLYQMANFLWDADKDGYVSYTVETPKFFAVCSVFYIYFD